MVNNLTEGRNCGYEWIDITDPQANELWQVARQYGLHEESVLDCMQPGHLPKCEQLKNYTFTILRVYYATDKDADTVQELTNKIAIFTSDKFIITIHRNPIGALTQKAEVLLSDTDCRTTQQVLVEIVKTGLHTYDEPGKQLTDLIEYYETQVFLTTRKVSLLKGLYLIKRKTDVIRRLLLLTHDIVDKIDPPASSNAYTRDVRDLYVKQKSLHDSMSENANHLLNIYFNISSQRTNETMRVLTIFSVFFMPLTFIVGIYGMNFHNMPELGWKWGYPLTLASMAIVTIIIYLWFRRKKWL